MARAILPVVLLIALALAGCSSGDDDTDSQSSTSTSGRASGTVSASGSVSVSGTGAPSNDTEHKSIVDDDFPNGDFTIQRGDTVNWTAMATSHPHSVTSDLPLFDSSPSCSSATVDGCMEAGDSYEFEFQTVGTFTYHCRIHPTTMTGTITVTE